MRQLTTQIKAAYPVAMQKRDHLLAMNVYYTKLINDTGPQLKNFLCQVCLANIPKWTPESGKMIDTLRSVIGRVEEPKL